MNQPLETHKALAVLALSLTLFSFAPVSAQVPSTEVADVDFVGGAAFMVDDVPNNTVVVAYQVPAGVEYKLTDLIISNPNPIASLCAKILRDGTERTGCIVVPAEGTVTMNFLTAVGFPSGAQVEVSNGDDAGPIHFTGRGYRYTRQ